MSGKGGGVETPGGGGWCPDIFWGLGFRGDGVFGNVKNGIFHLVYCGFSFTLRFARNSRGKKIWCWRKDALRKRSRPVDFLVPNVNDIGYLFCRVFVVVFDRWVSEFLCQVQKTHHKTAEALGQVTWCGQWTPWSPWRAEEDLVKKRTHIILWIFPIRGQRTVWFQE